MKTKPHVTGIELKVLMLEDSLRDLELMHEQLASAGYEINATHVENKADFTNTLRKERFDLILADFKLPDFDGFSALELSRELCPQTPFIFVSGTIGEETAVELLKRGAVDYVFKEKPERLPYAVKRALEEAKVKADYQKTVDALRQSEEKFRSLADTAKVMISIVEDSNGSNYLYVNHEWEQVTGYSKEEAQSIKPIDLVAPEHQEEVLENAAIRSKGKQVPVTYELKIITRSGDTKYLDFSSTIIDFENKKAFLTTGIDITDRKRAQEEAMRREVVLNKVFDILPIGLWFADKDGKLLKGNSAGIKIWGAEPQVSFEEYGVFQGRRLPSREEIQPHDWALAHTIQKKVTISDELLEIDAFDGKTKTILNYTAPVLDDNGETLGAIVMNIDITEKKQSEDALQEKIELLERVFDNNLDLVALTDLEGNFTLVSKSHEIMGYDLGYLIGKNVMGFLHPEDLAHANKEIVRFLESGEARRVEYRSRHLDGNYLWFETIGTILRDKHGNPEQILFNSRDITERKRAEEADAKQRGMMTQAEDLAELGSWEWDIKNDTWSTSKNWKRIHGTTDSVLHTHDLLLIAHPEDRPAIEEAFAKATKNGEIYEVQHRIIRQDTGETRHVYARGLVVFDLEGKPEELVGAVQDITERKKMMEELIAAKEKAQKSDKLKTAFINNISHEIRTPLNGILGFGALLSETDPAPEVKKEMLERVQQSSNRLMNTMSDYIDIARIVSGTLEVSKKEFLLQPLLEEITQKTRPLFASKQIDFEVDYPESNTDITIDSASELISKTLYILLDNALKFTTRGSVTCGYKLKEGFIEFYTKDTGKGIAPDMLDEIFTMFTQEDSSDTRGHEGSGLGLSIASGLVKLLGGEISVTSKEGKGSTFAFTIPYEATTVAEKALSEEKAGVAAAEKPLVLLAEDEESNSFFVTTLLRLAGYHYLLAENGEEAVALCKQHPDIKLVLMDIKMPVMNGLEATRLIREFRPELPIIATTAYAQTGDEQRFLDAGCNGYLAKPFKQDSLVEILKKNTGSTI